jgi:hypothetical protein
MISCTLPRGVASVWLQGDMHIVDAVGTILFTTTVDSELSSEQAHSALISGSLPACFGIGNANAASASIYVARVTHRDEAEVSQASKGLLCSSLNDLDEGFQSKMHKHHPDQSFFSAAFQRKVAAEAHSRRGSAGLPGAISHEVPLAVLRGLRVGLPDLIEKHVHNVSEAIGDRLSAAFRGLVDAAHHPRLLRLLLDTASDLVEQRLQAALVACRMLVEFENDETHTANHYYMDIVQDLRSEVLGNAGDIVADKGEGTWSKRPYLQGYDLKQLKEKSNHEQELLDMQIKTFAYWKTAEKRLVDYVQACVPPTSSNYTIYTPAWLPPLYHSPLSLPLSIGPAADVRSLTSLDRPHRAAAQAGARRGSRERVQPEQHGGADGARR